MYQEVITSNELDLQPLGYVSKALSTQEITYSIFEKELRAIFYSIRYFDQFLSMHQFTIYCDNKSLVHTFQKTNVNLEPRVYRLFYKVIQYNPEIIHINSE